MTENNKKASVNNEPVQIDDAARLNVSTTTLKSTFCNMCNATSTHEEVVLNLGVKQSWDRGQAEYEVNLEHRNILSPFAAKRLSEMLGKLMQEYEGRYGELK